MTSRILIVDDEAAICSMLMREFRKSGISTEYVTDPVVGLERLADESFDLVITDLMMPGIDGLEFLKRAKKIRPTCEIVMMTAHATVETVREALKRGATDYLTKPFSIANELRPLVARVLDAGNQTAPPIELAASTSAASLRVSDDTLDGIVAHSEPMRAVLSRARRVARSDVPVLLQGQSGTGKEVIANAIHRLSPRCDAPFVKINCAALPESLLESELFGYAKGSFTGAAQSRVGLFEAADGGTLLLDEIGEISSSVQPKLLRVLQEGEFYRVGDATSPIKVNVRVIAATNRNLAAEVDAGRFRGDLYYRLNVVPIEIPSLRDHIEDLEPLLNHFTKLVDGKNEVACSAEALRMLRTYPWPGNIRELINAINFALVMKEGDKVNVSDLPAAIQEFHRNEGMMTSEVAIFPGDRFSLEEMEKQNIVRAMKESGRNRTHAARLLGITRRTLGCRISKHHLEAELEGLEQEPRSTKAPRPRVMAKVRASQQSEATAIGASHSAGARGPV
ncbi:MAG: two-component system response regulator AtoC, partial [Myxococcota bacterium]